MLDELPLRAADVVIRPKDDAEREIDEGRDERNPAGSVRTEEQARDRRRHRHGEHKGENGKAQGVHNLLLVIPAKAGIPLPSRRRRSEEHTSALQSLMRSSYAVFCL